VLWRSCEKGCPVMCRN